MIPQVAKRGTSFKGAGLYYLHDKRDEGEAERLTSERVAWTHTRNLATDDPEFSLRIMAATAMSKDRLKEAAGIKNTGRKSKGEVYAYSLAWHPDEKGKFTCADMLQAADQSLKALGANDHQAVIIAHRDEPHPHIHIIVNMVHPKTGKNLTVSNDRNKLNQWSNEYRKARGEEHIYCPNKAKKFEAIEAKRKGASVDFVAAPKAIPRQLHDAFEAVKASVSKPELQATYDRERAKDFALSQDGRKMASRHASQWDALSDNYKLRKDGIKKRYYAEKKDAHEAIKEQMKPAFKALYRQQWQERKGFEAREKRLFGKLQNMAEAAEYAKMVRGEDNSSLLSSIFNFMSAAASRAAWLSAKHDNQVRDLRKMESGQKRDATSQLQQTMGRRYKSARQDFALERSALIGRQGSERADLRDRWRLRNEQKKKAIRSLEVTGRIAAKDEELVQDGDKITAKRKFKERTAEREGRSKGRSRSRKRRTE